MKRNNIYKLLFDHVIVDQDLVSNSMLQFFLVANFDKVIDKYGEIGYRFILIEAGHIAQNFNLVAVALDLACINIGGYIENYANKILGIDDIRSSVLYMFAIGAKDIVV